MWNQLRAFCGLFCLLNAFPSVPIAHGQTGAANWRNDYHAALGEASASGKLVLLWFFPSSSAAADDELRLSLFAQPEVAQAIAREFVPVALPTDAEIESAGQQIKLLSHPAFAEMRQHPGLALIDMRDEESPHFRHVVSIFPFDRRPITATELLVLLQLPPGTLTQRSLIFAVRTHPEHPASAHASYSPLLANETEKHADHQASITLQGHHNWEQRFHAINAQLPSGLVAQEVCAESWPGQNLMDAAIECVHSWRQSPGHWSAVSGPQSLFAYDMKRGKNGTWYATGIFARHH
jgi:hypothetical protein